MKKPLIAITDFVVSLLIALFVVAPASAAAHERSPADHQAGKSSVYHFDVAESQHSGKLMINVEQQKFVFNGKDFAPDALYALYYRTEGSADHLFASAIATRSGNLHLAGTWDKGAALLTQQDFGVGATGAVPGELQGSSLFVSYWAGDAYTLSGFGFPADWRYPKSGDLSLANCSVVITTRSKTTSCDGTVTVSEGTYSGHVSY